MHLSRSDFVLGKWSLPKSERDGGKDFISCAKNSLNPARGSVGTLDFPCHNHKGFHLQTVSVVLPAQVQRASNV